MALPRSSRVPQPQEDSVRAFIWKPAGHQNSTCKLLFVVASQHCPSGLCDPADIQDGELAAPMASRCWQRRRSALLVCRTGKVSETYLAPFFPIIRNRTAHSKTILAFLVAKLPLRMRNHLSRNDDRGLLKVDPHQKPDHDRSIILSSSPRSSQTPRQDGQESISTPDLSVICRFASQTGRFIETPSREAENLNNNYHDMTIRDRSPAKRQTSAAKS